MSNLAQRRRIVEVKAAHVRVIAASVGVYRPARSTRSAPPLGIRAVKSIGETSTHYRVAGYAVVFGGVDLQGTFFDRSTRFWDGFKDVPFLYEHGFDPAVGKCVLGRVVAQKTDDVGIWVEAQIDRAAAYATAVMDLVRRGLIGLSSGSVSHLVEIASNGKVLSWPVAEVSATVSPAEPRTLGLSEVAKMRALAARPR